MSFVRVLRRFLLRSHCNVNQCKSLGTGIDAQHVGDRHGIEVTRPDTSDFLPPNKAFAVKSNWELFRGWLVFKMFTYNSLVDNSKALYQFSRRFLGYWLTEKLLRASVFGQFTGGLNEAESEVVVRKLAQHGVSTIWFFSDEKDLGEVEPPKTMEQFKQQEFVYQTTNEKYLKAIEMSAACNCDRPTRFAAIKLTAIVNPSLLRRLGQILLASDETFFSLLSQMPQDPAKVNTTPSLRKIPVPVMLQSAELNSKTMDIVDWRSFFSLPHNVHKFQLLPQLYKEGNKVLPDVSLTDVEQDQLQAFVERLHKIGKCASGLGVRVLIDAEQNYFQEAIEHLTLHYMMKQFNHTHPVIYNTAQAYLKRVHNSLSVHVATTRRMGIQCGMKLVRGCYLEYETQLASKNGCVSPIHPSKQATDSSYHRALEYLLNEVQKGHVHMMVASHNKHSVEEAIVKMKELGLSPADGSVTFGQQLGMGDHLSYPLAQAGFIVNKVLAYGSLENIVPFLVRRAQENRGFIRNAQEERFFYINEMKRRLFS